jgi:two-component system OmpR family response regulator
VRILVIEDDGKVASFIQTGLEQEGYAVDVLNHGNTAGEQARVVDYDAVVLDLMLPGRSGFQVLRDIRSRKPSLPVIMLTAKNSLDERVAGLDAGADDYMAKPFALSELEARVRALTRRAAGGAQTILKHGPLTLDQVGHVAYLGERMLDLSARELSLLEILLQRPGRLVSKEQLVDHMCSWGEEVSTNAIEVYVHRLRKKIETDNVRIVTVRGLGYYLERFADPTAEAAGSA